MPHFLIKKEEIKEGFIELIDKETFFHVVKVLRIKKGEKIKFIDSDQFIYNCEVTEIEKNSLRAKILQKEKSARVLGFDLCLVQSLLASDAQNLLVANATQAGVRAIYPVVSDRVTTTKDKNEKWQKIAFENFKQCERADIPSIEPVLSLFEALGQFKKENVLIFAEKKANIALNRAIENIDKSQKIAIVVGPEGGFSDEEFEYFIKNDYKLISLGSMIYKAPNAVVAAVSNVITRL